MEIEGVDQTILELDEKIKDAQENLGDTEVREALYNKFLENNGRKLESIEIYKKTLDKSLGISKKLEIAFRILKIYLQEKNLKESQKCIQQCYKLLEEGGDWEKKNKLKVYEGLFLLLTRDFGKAANLFIESVSTFNSSEIISFVELVKYTVLISLISLKRLDLKQQVFLNNQVFHSPDILTCIREIPHVKNLMESFYKCDYKCFFVSFNEIIQQLDCDFYLSQHKKYFIQQMRIVVYSQFLESYKTVTISSMARQFGVSENLIDKEISSLVASKKLNCKIDMVQGLIQSEKADLREIQYQSTLKAGDLLLNKIQKLARAIQV